jgi:peptide/nickel transport system permease protein
MAGRSGSILILMGKRVAEVAIALWIIATLIFCLTALSGDPSSLFLQPGMSQADVLAVRERLGLDLPLIVQYAHYIRDLLRGDLGTSIFYNEPAVNVVLSRLPATLQLAGASALIAVILGLGSGLILGARIGPKFFQEALRWFIFLGQSIPVFVLGLLFILVFAVQWRLLPAGGSGSFSHLILPAISLGIYFAPPLARLMQASLRETLTEDFITFARGKGLSKSRIIFRHALPSAITPVIALGAMQLGLLLNGTVVTETIFAWPGIGRLVVDAVLTKDFPVAQVGTLFGAVAFMTVNLLTDALQGTTDIRGGES